MLDFYNFLMTIIIIVFPFLKRGVFLMDKAAQGVWLSAYLKYVEGQNPRRTQSIGKRTVSGKEIRCRRENRLPALPQFALKILALHEA